MITRPFFFLLSIFSIQILAAQQFDSYQFTLDLTSVNNDQLQVQLIPPKMTADSVVYRFPAMVPGTYKVYNFGRFTSGFKAVDASGKELPVKHTDDNSWVIRNAQQLAKISYTVQDCWDTDIKEDFVFEPAGTNIQKDTNFVINTHGFFGYFDGMTKKQYTISITHPTGFFGTTGLSSVNRSGNTDVYSIPNYNDLVDGPIMYNKPDTTHILVGGADILISVYSPQKKVSSKFVADSLRVLLDQQRQYLGGTLPIKNYAFIIYLTDNAEGYKSGALGALEHSYSSMYALQELDPASIAQTIKDVAAHEFFHIVTPLNIHSEEIGNFDFNNPKMSQHLWLYEGLTEYAAHHVQIKNGTLSLEDFLIVMRRKMVLASTQFNDELSFTEMSKGCLDKYEKEYGNVYEKGALIAMCLDIQLRQLSNGAYGTQELIRDLSKYYGKDKSFQDDSLFSVITRLTYPEIGEFFKKYVIGNAPLPFDEMLDLVGINYKKKKTELGLTPFGGFGIDVNEEGKIFFSKSPDVNDFGREMGYMDGDEILSLNGRDLKLSNAQKVFDGFMQRALNKRGYKIKIKVRRKMEDGSMKTIKLKGRMHPVDVVQRHVLKADEDLNADEAKLRKAWINQ
jgi:predicted metalloprotease with PDZ domain